MYAPSGPQTSVTVTNYVDSNGVYQPSSGTFNVYPAAAVGDLAAEFTPPVHVVTVESRSASVPIQIGWLLGGLLLELGVKRAVGR